ncbi:MAG: hypothetical protein AB7E79_09640 [Rhodospirillaceae bacterium]
MTDSPHTISCTVFDEKSVGAETLAGVIVGDCLRLLPPAANHSDAVVEVLLGETTITLSGPQLEIRENGETVATFTLRLGGQSPALMRAPGGRPNLWQLLPLGYARFDLGTLRAGDWVRTIFNAADATRRLPQHASLN